eukprot:SAG31_NODE_5515_length_2484_cov_4.819287_2_plen_173_part_00
MHALTKDLQQGDTFSISLGVARCVQIFSAKSPIKSRKIQQKVAVLTSMSSMPPMLTLLSSSPHPSYEQKKTGKKKEEKTKKKKTKKKRLRSDPRSEHSQRSAIVSDIQQAKRGAQAEAAKDLAAGMRTIWRYPERLEHPTAACGALVVSAWRPLLRADAATAARAAVLGGTR